MVYLHEMLKRHQDERELMLAHLQDDSTEDLIDAAKTMTDEDRQKRLAELQGKRQNLHFSDPGKLNLKAPIATKVVCFSRRLKCLRTSMAISVVPDQTAPIGAVCSGSTLFASILNLSVMSGNYLQQTTSADDIFRCIFFMAL